MLRIIKFRRSAYGTPSYCTAPPPSYDSLFGRVREARKTSKGVADFLKNILIILLGAGKKTLVSFIHHRFLNGIWFSVGCTVILGITIIIPICMIIMGSLYLHECPQGEYIPVYLLVGGIFGVLKQLLHLSTHVRKREEEREVERLRQSPTQTLLNCFMLGWFIIGNYNFLHFGLTQKRFFKLFCPIIELKCRGIRAK